MKWWPVLAVAVVTSALAIVINLATDSPASWPLWAGVALLTLLSAVVTRRASGPDAPAGDVTNRVDGDVSGTVIQARDINGGIRLPRDGTDPRA